jgi:predicted phosphate transport protein (TIGR00153 family)
MLSWFRALMPKDDRFFDLFARHSQKLVAGAAALQGLLEGGDTVQHYAREIVAREQEADEITREVLLAVRRTFITPFDRSDIQDLIQSMDDAIDQMQKTVKTITLFEVRSFDPLMQKMGETIVDAARLTADAIPLLRAIGTHAGPLGAFAEEVMRVEGRADELHDEGLKSLFREHGTTNAMAYIIGSEIFGHLESVVDRFEDVANRVNSIVIENV